MLKILGFCVNITNVSMFFITDKKERSKHMADNQFEEAAEMLKEKQKYIEAEKILSKKTGLSISIQPNMTLEQMHEILMKEMKMIIKDPRCCAVQGLGQGLFTGISIRGVNDIVLDVSTRDTRSPDAIWIHLESGHLAFYDHSIIELTLEAEKAEQEKTLEQKQQRALVSIYDKTIRGIFKSKYPDVLPDLQIKPGMNSEQMREVFFTKLKTIAEKPETTLVRSGDSLIFRYNDGTTSKKFFSLVIDNNSKNYGRVGRYVDTYSCRNLDEEFDGGHHAPFDVYDKQMADYFVKEYDRLSKIERLPEPQPQAKKEKGLFDKIVGFFKGNSKF